MKIAHKKRLAKKKNRNRELRRQQLIDLGLRKAPAKKAAK
jgi:hypothetical protein